MSIELRWLFGAFMGLLSLLGLFLASRGADPAMYWMGLILFLGGVVTVFHLIRTAFDAAEGKVSEQKATVPLTLIAVAVGSVLFHLWSPWWWTPIASNWQYIDDTLSITFWITGVAFSLVVLFMAYCVFRFRHREGGRAAYEPESKRLEWWLTVGTAVGVIAMLAPGLVVWKQFITVPAEASEVEVVGQQWQWSYRLPGKDGRLGTTDTMLISAENPLGINPQDPNGRDDLVVQGGSLHLPLGKPVKVLLRSTDVLHDFYVPEFRAKMDMIPGMVTYFWITPTRPGSFEVICAELCGVGHPQMRGGVVVLDDKGYQEWLGQQTTFAQLWHSRHASAASEVSPSREGAAAAEKTIR